MISVLLPYVVATGFLQQTNPDSHFVPMTKEETADFTKAVTDFKGQKQFIRTFVEPSMQKLRAQNPNWKYQYPDPRALYFKFEFFRGRDGQGFDFWWGMSTPLKYGFRMKLDVHLTDGTTETRYEKTIENLWKLKSDNIVYYFGRSQVAEIDMLILTQDGKNLLNDKATVQRG